MKNKRTTNDLYTLLLEAVKKLLDGDTKVAAR
jgi:hypothetical protein